MATASAQQAGAPPAPAGPTGPARTDPQRDVLPLLIAELQQEDAGRSWRAAVEILRYVARHRAAVEARPGLAALTQRVEQGTPEQQRAVIKAVGEFFRLPPDPIDVTPEVLEVILPLLRPAMRSPSRELGQDALRALAELDRGVVGGRPIIDRMLDQVVSLRPGPAPSAQEVTLVVRALGQRRPTEVADLKATVGRLVAILRTFTTPGRSEKYKEATAQVLDELHALTGWRFRRSRDAIDWWAANEQRAPLEWYRERLAQSEQEVQAAGQAARKWWRSYIGTLNGDAERLLRELIDSALKAEIPDIRADAVRELARVAARPETGPERAERAYQAVIAALDPGDAEYERNPEVLKALLEVLVQTPPTTPQQQELAGLAAARALAANTDRDVRLLAIRAIGALRASSREALRELYGALRAERPDPAIAIAALEALARVGLAQDLAAGLRELNAFLRRERTREEEDPQRDARLLSAALTTLAAIGRRSDLDAALPEVLLSVDEVVGLLSFHDRVDPVAGPRVRQLAVLALADLKRPEALAAGATTTTAPLLLAAMSDPDADVARYAVDAVGALASKPSATPEHRKAALRAFAEAERTRPELSEQLLANASRVARADLVAGVRPLLALAARLSENAKEPADYSRLARLLVDLPAEVPDGVDASAFGELRLLLAEGLLRGQEPDHRKAMEVLATLEGKEVRPRLLLADALARGVADEIERADRIYGELIAEGGDAGLLWARRLQAAAALVERDRTRGLALIERQLGAGGGVPELVREGLEALRKGPTIAPPADTSGGAAGSDATPTSPAAPTPIGPPRPGPTSPGTTPGPAPAPSTPGSSPGATR